MTAPVLVVAQFVPDADPTPALGALAASRIVLVRPPALAALPVPAAVELAIDTEFDRAAIAAHVRRHADELIVVLLDDEALSPDLAGALTALAAAGAPGCYSALRRAHFLGRVVESGPVTLAWRGASTNGTAANHRAPARLPGHVHTPPATVTDVIDRLEGLATYVERTAPVGPADFVRRPLAAMARRLWHRRRAGIAGFMLSLIETYGEVLRAAQAWERHGIAARRAERQSGVPGGFHIWRTPWGTLTLRDGTQPALRTALLDATPSVVAGMPLAGGRGAVWAVELGDGTRGVLRWYRRGGFIRHLVYDRYFGWTPRPIRELAVTEAVIERGVAAPEVVAARVDRLPWGWYRGAIVTREIGGAVTFADALRELPPGDARRERLVRTVGRAIRGLHDRGVHHRDLNANNILVALPGAAADGIAVHFIDFDRAEVHPAVPTRVRERELRRLERSLAKLAARGMPLAADDARTLRAAYDAGAAS